MSRLRLAANPRVEWLLFFMALLAFAWFHQGGGWNQNARFGEVRAIVEEGRFAIDDFLVYRTSGSDGDLARLPVEDGQVILDGHRMHLAWVDAQWNLYPVGGGPALGRDSAVALSQVAASGDVSYARGHFHPNKPPGTSFLAVPAYFCIHLVEGWLGIDPDGWWTLSVNAWLTSVCSVGVIAALGSVLFFRLALWLSGERLASLLATIAFTFGTLFFPFATLLFDHDIVAVALMGAVYWIAREEDAASAMRGPFLAGLCAGIAAITNYLAAVAVVLIALYLIARAGFQRKTVRALAFYSLGVLGPLALICGYNAACFGSPFALANDFQNPLFADTSGKLFGMFGLPDPQVAALLLVSPMRGIFYSSPVLLVGVYGLVRMWLRRAYRPEMLLFLALCVFFFLANATFFGWHAGFACGSRYLIPALPFLGLPMVFGFRDFPRTSVVLGVLSAAMQLSFAAVDAQSPVGIGSIARVEPRTYWQYDTVTQYSMPLLFTGRAWPLLNAQLAGWPDEHDAEGMPDVERRARLEKTRQDLLAGIVRGDSDPFLLAAVCGPVSVNPIGMSEGAFFAKFAPGSIETRWASFNIGEFLFPQSLWSLAPLLAILSAGFWMMLRWTRKSPIGS